MPDQSADYERPDESEDEAACWAGLRRDWEREQYERAQIDSSDPKEDQ